MSQTIDTTIRVGEGASETIEAMLNTFPTGSEVRVAVTPTAAAAGRGEAPSLKSYRDRVRSARESIGVAPWATTAEALAELREGEQA